MERATLFRLLADGVLFLHTSFVAFVVVGLLLILIGAARRWNWIRNPWFRLAHVGAITVVAVQAWLGVLCPLTVLESRLRSRAGDGVYRETFVEHWLQALLYYDAPLWLFAPCYTLFGLAVIGAWIVIRPRPMRARRSG